jgi:SAM-dependent methyltransferase
MSEARETDTVARFNDRADDYVRYRPTYPDAAIAAILDGLGAPAPLVAADVGAGTGISARLLAARGVRVVAIEPGEAMRRAADPHPRVQWMAAVAEAIALRTACVRLVLSAQSFHWFRPADALREFARILVPDGRLVIMWNRRSTTDAFTTGYRQAILDVGGEIAAERMPFDPEVLASSGLFTAPARRGFANAQRLDLNGLIGRARSASYVPKSGPDGERLLRLLRDLHARHADADGLVTLVYDTDVYTASLREHGSPRRGHQANEQ